ncbi:hypothetical protein AMECASPLE_034064 [Ameca splendens]|uniref:Uncharacterized protein n=1 Tax=Ameca splendens TaxID=208324 RepID=A0ABV1ADF8_9TELE
MFFKIQIKCAKLWVPYGHQQMKRRFIKMFRRHQDLSCHEVETTGATVSPQPRKKPQLQNLQSKNMTVRFLLDCVWLFVLSVLPCDGPVTCPGCALPPALRLLEIGTSITMTHYGRSGRK